jgi:translation initiation factor 2-alpha kinase 4
MGLILDFGLVTVRGDVSPILEASPLPGISPISITLDIGTPVYTAPEITAGKAYNSKVDMYSLGICFFEVIFGIFI